MVCSQRGPANPQAQIQRPWSMHIPPFTQGGKHIAEKCPKFEKCHEYITILTLILLPYLQLGPCHP